MIPTFPATFIPCKIKSLFGLSVKVESPTIAEELTALNKQIKDLKKRLQDGQEHPQLQRD